MITVSAIFCLECGSSLVDVNGWELPRKAVIQCAECGNETTIKGFSLGRTHIHAEPYIHAANDVAVYGRNPNIVKLIQGKAKKEIKYDQLINEK